MENLTNIQIVESAFVSESEYLRGGHVGAELQEFIEAGCAGVLRCCY